MRPTEPSEELDDALLVAFREGRLDAATTARVERRLLEDPEARALLVGLGRPVPAGARARAEALLPERRFAWAWAWGGAGVLAAAAAVAIALLRGPGPAPAAYELEGPFGGIRVARAAPEAPTSVFLPNSRLRIVLRPKGAPAAVAAAFVEDAAGRLRALPAEVVALGKGGAVRIEGLAGELLGPGFGPRRLRVALATDPEALAHLAGGPFAETAPGVRWATVELEYREAIDGP